MVGYAAAVIVSEDRSYWASPIENLKGALVVGRAVDLLGYFTRVIDLRGIIPLGKLQDSPSSPSVTNLKHSSNVTILYVAERICCACRIYEVCKRFVKFQTDTNTICELLEWAEQEFEESPFYHRGTSPYHLEEALMSDFRDLSTEDCNAAHSEVDTAEQDDDLTQFDGFDL